MTCLTSTRDRLRAHKEAWEYTCCPLFAVHSMLSVLFFSVCLCCFLLIVLYLFCMFKFYAPSGRWEKRVVKFEQKLLNSQNLFCKLQIYLVVDDLSDFSKGQAFECFYFYTQAYIISFVFLLSYLTAYVLVGWSAPAVSFYCLLLLLLLLISLYYLSFIYAFVFVYCIFLYVCISFLFDATIIW